MVEHAAMAALQTLKEKLPLMRTGEGHRIRNIIVGTGYLFLLLFILGAAMGPAEVADDTTSANDSSNDGSANDTQAEPAANNTTDSEGDEANTSEGNESAGEPAQEQAAEEATQEPEPAAEPAQEPVKSTEEQAQAAGSGDSDGPGPADMERVLATENIEVEVHETANGDLHANYYSTATNEEELATDLGAIAGTYAAVVDGGHDSDQLTIEVRTNAGQPVGEYVVKASDARAFVDGEITANEFALRVIASGTVYEDAQTN